MDFTNKVVLITGSGAGIGRETAIQFAQNGAKVIVNSRSKRGEETLKILKEQGFDAIFVQADVSKLADIKKMVQAAIDAYGRIDILVNNAAVVLPGTIETTTEEDLLETLLVNVQGTFLVSKYVVKEMKKQGGGVIVNVGSVAAEKGHKNRSAYSASKGAVLALTKSIAMDCLDDNIRVNCVSPGTTITEGVQAKIDNAEHPEAMLAMYLARQPMNRLAKSSEIAHTILFAACEEAAFMNGSNITIDGGLSI
ncbi:SDR family NAD(P)-dependent oxidoreductase [Robertmurraya massiliosenegalensis]|uniref:SDR family NAD(P)-dependent oxidoreductase n=1 Tax=Robertmurraya massiliosenegalensis TaxID=1287657 RepID=UPI00030BA521|nr:SDR family oxidoreductase [Robertmurraya massiliosenegalensis]